MAAYDLVATAYVLIGAALLIYILFTFKKKRTLPPDRGNSN
jgi:hypothetical protein